MGWNEESIPSMAGRVAIVTGANSGIGFEAARILAERGAQVILACRSPERGGAALERIRERSPAGSAALSLLDLSSLESVRAFSERFLSEHQRLDLLINNAGVMIPPASLSSEGFELQFGVNHLGHFALTGLLLERLLETDDARVVTVSSMAHRWGAIRFDNLRSERSYWAWREYGQSKLANLLFHYELSRRLQGRSLKAVASHPGATRSELQRHQLLISWGTVLIGMSPTGGGLTTLRAAVDPLAECGDYYGPSWPFELRGSPVKVRSNKRSRDPELAARLWDWSVEATGVGFEALSA